jgi:hypothetical protein
MWQQTTDVNGTWTVIPNSSSYIYQPPALTQTTHYRRVVRETLCGTSATSNVVSILVNSTPITLHGGVIQTSSTCVLLGNTAPAINNVTNNFGGTAPYTFEWEKKD